MTHHSRRAVLGMLGAAPLAAGLLPGLATAHADTGLAGRIQAVTDRPEFAGSRWGMRFQVHGATKPIHVLNPQQRFEPASAVKLFIAGSAFDALGPSHRFRTTVHRTGPVVLGTLRGDLTLVAGGDLLLGPRVRRDGSLALPVPDHSYGTAGQPIAGDPLQQLRHLARQVARHGVRRVDGTVRVDTSLFRQGTEALPQGNLQLPVSPMMINDNIVDVVVRPGDRIGAPATLRVTPELGYVDIVNEVTTVATPSRRLAFSTSAGVVRLTGKVALGAAPLLCPYFVPDPAGFAEVAFTQALAEEGIDVTGNSVTTVDRRMVRLAEHVSLPLSEEVKVMLKLSSNVHTVYFPYLVGAIAGGDPDTPKATGQRLRRELVVRAGLDPDDPANGGYTPDYFVRFLEHMARQPYFTRYREGLPVMGRDGTLADVLPNSPAAGRVFAKTGTGGTSTGLYKAMAGYLCLPDGTLVVFAEFMEKPVSSPEEAFALEGRVGVAQGEIVTAVYESLVH
ncbi:D-alanyl-D-alanine carboxypeptidase/D-alanyl-D-alanine endopeptidase [Amycolatopsis vastitatis]|nr:D-alanyl-D-alanine carboxypeptidase/D-alanyl-D-alanine-endopeptidase [Amycolatopsis vastitatis]